LPSRWNFRLLSGPPGPYELRERNAMFRRIHPGQLAALTRLSYDSMPQ
jgi:hypothetical protein